MSVSDRYTFFSRFEIRHVAEDAGGGLVFSPEAAGNGEPAAAGAPRTGYAVFGLDFDDVWRLLGDGLYGDYASARAFARAIAGARSTDDYR